ncbi:hypothetical protein HPY09_15185 [Vibrio cholerae]|uniref:hypothetical protein n=2 Tax=Vibrio TaxID=662 RepID=UPI001583189A|nr:hypothetical protein [Vibrio cholerae]QKU72272.1 hypothetical protein HPY09_14890 [Vibrio cholerae]QKU72311.1 hypothetical protein HPY09_15185 [Vibrio cholerae]QKU76222.1 hypothetical protein HPY05_14885 [Vibrio cholerae]QKU76258.1 hypothetical protein HPY05_15180 [Vibrio cholerae]
MLEEFKKSFNSVLYERVSSPLYGTFIVAWVICNWKILYVTLFVSENELAFHKLKWIETYALNLSDLLYKPIISTIFFLTIMPFVSNGFYWLHLRFHKWKVDTRNSIEMKSLLTLEQSIEIRRQMENMSNMLNSTIENKDIEIKQLRIQLESSEQEQPIKIRNSENTASTQSLKNNNRELVLQIIENPSLSESFDTVLEYIQAGWTGAHTDEKISPRDLAFLEAHDVIQSKGDGAYVFGPEGKNVLKEIFAIRGQNA